MQTWSLLSGAGAMGQEKAFLLLLLNARSSLDRLGHHCSLINSDPNQIESDSHPHYHSDTDQPTKNYRPSLLSLGLRHAEQQNAEEGGHS